MSSPTARTLKLLRDSGATCAVVEKWIEATKQRKDLFDCIDLVALRPGQQGIGGFQATSDGNHSARVHKILHLQAAKLWIECGNRLFVVSWGKKGPRGKMKRWTPRFEEITIGMFEA